MPIQEFVRRIRYLLNRRRYDEELANDMEVHREMAAREGRRFGNALRLREEARDAWGWTWIDRLAQDIRYAVRMAQRSPSFTVAAVAILALGIGVNVAAFGFFNVLVLRPLPVRDPDTLVRFDRRSPQNLSDNLPYAAVAFYRQRTRTLLAILASHDASLESEGEEKPIAAHFVTANFHRELGAIPALGRMFDPSLDEAPDAAPVVVLSHGFWQRHFGAEPLVVGTTIRLNHEPVTIVGVASREFSGFSLDTPDVWMPITQEPYVVKGLLLTDFSGRGPSVQMWGRLPRGLSPRVAEEELKMLAAELRAQHPADIWRDESLPSQPAGYAINAVGSRSQVYGVFGLIGALMLLILSVACSNLGSLLLARGLARRREFAIRTAVGAGRGRLLGQLLTEQLVLALLGSAAGLMVGYAVLRSLLARTEALLWLDPTPDWRVIVFAVGLGIASAIVFGLPPAWQVARQRHRATFVRQMLIGVQVAASCMLLIVAGLLIRALDHALSAPQGFDYQHVISIDPGFRDDPVAGARAYLDALQRRLGDLPGVESISIASNPPLGNRWTVMRADIAGRAVDVHINNVDPAFFRTMTIPIVRGRSLMRGEARAIVVSDSLARLQWPGEDPIGKSFTIGKHASTVVGVSGSARLVSPENSDAVEAYQLAADDVLPSVVLLVKTSVPPERVVPSVRSLARSIDPKGFPQIEVMKEAFERKVQPSRYAALAVSALGAAALLLASVGVVGLVMYAVSQRSKEIGIRMALGATSAGVLSSVLGRFARPVVGGLIAGVGGAALLSQILRRVLFGVSNLDPIAYLSAIVVFLVIVALAALVPARRALGVDPLLSLREE